MKRFILSDLSKWKESRPTKPLILRGARQVGKTYVLKQFGEFEYVLKGSQFHFIDLSKQPELHSAFKEEKSAHGIVLLLELALKKRINLSNDLLVIDEIQECSEAVSSLKAFAEEIPELDVIGSGSHLGLSQNEMSFPVGKVGFMALGPMTFAEFLLATNSMLFEYYSNIDIDACAPVKALIHESLLKSMRVYFAIGGLPEVVGSYISSINSGLTEQEALSVARTNQLNLLDGYRADFAKYAGRVNASHILHVFNSIPSQLAMIQDNSVKKFAFKNVIPKQGGFSKISGPLQWLVASRLCIKNLIATKPEHPVSGYCSENKFKLFMFDIGIMHCMLDIPMEAVVAEELGSYKGYLVENFVAQELYNIVGRDLYSWSSPKGDAEVEFLIFKGKDIVPLEVKSSRKARQAKSLSAYIDKFSPSIAYKVTAQNLGRDDSRNLITLPLYLIGRLH